MIWRHLLLAVSNVDDVPSHVVDRVGRIARGLEADVELFHSIYQPEMVGPAERERRVDTVIATQVEDAHRRLECIADMLRTQGVRARSSVRWDYPVYEAVVRQVLHSHADLLVVPATATTDIGRQTLHYREARLIETCPCPLLLLKAPEVYSKGCVVAAVDPLHAYEVPEELDETIVGAAKTVSYALAEAPVYLYHADPHMGAVMTSNPQGERARRNLVHERVRELAQRHNIPAANVRVDAGMVENALPEFARDARADVIVMGALSRTYAQRAILGHKAELVLDAVSCDILVVKPPGFTSPVGHEASPAVPLPGLERSS